MNMRSAEGAAVLLKMRSASLVAVLVLAATLSADGATTALVADTASAAMAITEAIPMQFFTFTPASNESITFSYTSLTGANIQAFAKRGGCPTTTADYHFSNDRYGTAGGVVGEIFIDPCSGSGEICFGVTFWGGIDDTTVQATATVSTAAGAKDVMLGATVANAVLHSGMNNLKITLPSGFLPAASFLRVRWEILDANFYTSAEFFVNQAGQCPTQKTSSPPPSCRRTTTTGSTARSPWRPAPSSTSASTCGATSPRRR